MCVKQCSPLYIDALHNSSFISHTVTSNRNMFFLHIFLFHSAQVKAFSHCASILHTPLYILSLQFCYFKGLKMEEEHWWNILRLTQCRRQKNVKLNSIRTMCIIFTGDTCTCYLFDYWQSTSQLHQSNIIVQLCLSHIEPYTLEFLICLYIFKIISLQTV